VSEWQIVHSLTRPCENTEQPHGWNGRSGFMPR
jgi:hypothetical protein